MRRTLLFLAGCGRFGFDAVPGDVLRDGTGGEVSVARPWDGEFTLTTPVPLANINTAAFETECFVTPDERTLYFASARGDFGLHDIFIATRSDPSQPFTGAMVVPELGTVSVEGRLVTGDGLTGYFWSDRPAGPAYSNIWVVTRASPSVAFSNAMVLANVSTDDLDYDPWPSRDGLRLYFSRVPAVGDDQDLYVASRNAPSGDFDAGTSIAELNTTFEEDNIAVSADHRFVVFSSTRPGVGLNDLYFSRRADANAQFDPPQLLPVVNTMFREYEACITESGDLFFSSDRPGGEGSSDIYQARFVPL